MWIIYVHHDVYIEQLVREDEDGFIIRPSSTFTNRYLSKNITHKIFDSKEKAYAYYNKFYPSWETHRMELSLDLDEDEQEALDEYDRNAFNLPKLFPEDFI